MSFLTKYILRLLRYPSKTILFRVLLYKLPSTTNRHHRMITLLVVLALLVDLCSSKSVVLDGQQFSFHGSGSNETTHWRCPKVICTGIGCSFATDSNGCQKCVCPNESQARGCDRMPYELWSEFMIKGCPIANNNANLKQFEGKAQKVLRWYRFVSRTSGADECRSYSYPFCRGQEALWPSPKSRQDCLSLCYASQSSETAKSTSTDGLRNFRSRNT